jgi:hypothetical protein
VDILHECSRNLRVGLGDARFRVDGTIRTSLAGLFDPLLGHSDAQGGFFVLGILELGG